MVLYESGSRLYSFFGSGFILLDEQYNPLFLSVYMTKDLQRIDLPEV
jgi:hypothetical protein